MNIKELLKFYLMFLMLIFAFGCIKEHKYDNRKEGNIIEITSTIISDSIMTRTSLGDDSLSTKWGISDTIGVFGLNSNNIKFGIKSGAGTPIATFTGVLNEPPLFAYYPYSPTSGEDYKNLQLNLPVIQFNLDLNKDISFLDYKVSSSIEKISNGEYNMFFRPIMSLFLLKIDPTNTDLIGDELFSLSLKVEGRKLGGEFTLDISDISKPPVFVNTAASSITIKFPGNTLLKTGEVINCFMFVNPQIKSGDLIYIDLQSSKHIARMEITSLKDIKGGYRYNLPLKLSNPSIKCEIEEVPPFFNFELPGAYADNGDTLINYRPFFDQWAYSVYSNNFSFRIQQNVESRLLKLSSVPLVFNVGDKFDINVDKYEVDNISPGLQNVKVLKIENNKAWLYNSSDKIGYIIYNRVDL